MAYARPTRAQPLRAGVLAAFLVLNIDAVRLDGGALSLDRSEAAGSASKASVPSAPDSAAARARRDRDLRAAANYIDSINVEDNLELGSVKDILEGFENINDRVLSFVPAGDARHRFQIRNILRHLREKGKALKALTGELEAEGNVDDGGDELPTQRNNICSRIHEYCVDLEFLKMVQPFCHLLGGVRKAVKAGEDAEPMAYSVSGVWRIMGMSPNYRQRNIGLEIERVLGEERRWVVKHFAPQEAGTGNALPLPEGPRTRFRTWALHMWEPQIWQDADADVAALSFALSAAHVVLVNAMVEDDVTLSSVRIRIQRIEFFRDKLAELSSRSNPVSSEQVRETLQEMSFRIDALGALAARKLAAGEVDNGGGLLPSERDMICTKRDGSGLEKDFIEDVRKICEAFERLHFIANIDRGQDKGVFEVLARLDAIRRRPGYWGTLVAIELENFLAVKWNWLFQQEEAIGA